MPPQAALLAGFSAGLVSLANYVSQKMPTVKVEILDLSDCSAADVRQRIYDLFSTDDGGMVFAGITTTTASYQSAIRVARVFKEAMPRIIVIFGGHHASADAETVLRSQRDVVDAIIVGEGERSLCELLSRYPHLDMVPGAAYLREGAFTTNDPPEFLTQDELSCLPVTFRDLGLIGIPGKFEHATYVSARGCPLKCAFCAVGGEPIRAKSVSAVVRDVEYLLGLGYGRIAIEDNFFAHAPARTRELCLALSDLKLKFGERFRWDCQTRVESLTEDTIGLLTTAGCEAVYIGVESLNPDHLRYLNKTPSPDVYLRRLTVRVMPALLNSSIECYLNLQFGLPGETEAQLHEGLAHLGVIARQASSAARQVMIFPQLHVVYPGTEHFRRGLFEKRFPSDVFESFTAWESEQTPVLLWLGEHFAHGTGGLPEGILQPEPLRIGKYVLNKEAVLRVAGILQAIDRIPGIQVFQYAKYLVTNKALTGAKQMVRLEKHAS